MCRPSHADGASQRSRLVRGAGRVDPWVAVGSLGMYGFFRHRRRHILPSAVVMYFQLPQPSVNHCFCFPCNPPPRPVNFHSVGGSRNSYSPSLAPMNFPAPTAPQNPATGVWRAPPVGPGAALPPFFLDFRPFEV